MTGRRRCAAGDPTHSCICAGAAGSAGGGAGGCRVGAWAALEAGEGPGVGGGAGRTGAAVAEHPVGGLLVPAVALTLRAGHLAAVGRTLHTAEGGVGVDSVVTAAAHAHAVGLVAVGGTGRAAECVRIAAAEVVAAAGAGGGPGGGCAAGRTVAAAGRTRELVGRTAGLQAAATH